jgi:hypothetical protein
MAANGRALAQRSKGGKRIGWMPLDANGIQFTTVDTRASDVTKSR